MSDAQIESEIAKARASGKLERVIALERALSRPSGIFREMGVHGGVGLLRTMTPLPAACVWIAADDARRMLARRMGKDGLPVPITKFTLRYWEKLGLLRVKHIGIRKYILLADLNNLLDFRLVPGGAIHIIRIEKLRPALKAARIAQRFERDFGPHFLAQFIDYLDGKVTDADVVAVLREKAMAAIQSRARAADVRVELEERHRQERCVL